MSSYIVDTSIIIITLSQQFAIAMKNQHSPLSPSCLIKTQTFKGVAVSLCVAPHALKADASTLAEEIVSSFSDPSVLLVTLFSGVLGVPPSFSTIFVWMVPTECNLDLIRFF